MNRTRRCGVILCVLIKPRVDFIHNIHFIHLTTCEHFGTALSSGGNAPEMHLNKFYENFFFSKGKNTVNTNQYRLFLCHHGRSPHAD